MENDGNNATADPSDPAVSLYNDTSSLAYTAYEKSNMTVHVELPLAHYLVQQGIIRGQLLDYGCGSGSFARVFVRSQGIQSVTGVDASPSQIQLAVAAEENDRLGIHYRVVDAQGSGLMGSFDTVWFAWVLVMIPSLEHVLDLLRNAYDNLVTGGHVVILTFLIGEDAAERQEWKDHCAKEGLQFDLLGNTGDEPFATRFTYQEFSVPNYYLSEKAYYQLLAESGFSVVSIIPAAVAANAAWKNYAEKCRCVAVVGQKVVQ